MPKVHQQKARKDYPERGIQKGEVYYKWSLRQSKAGRGMTFMSKTYPRPSQLTLSEFKSQWRGFAERLEDIEIGADDDAAENLKSELESIAEELRTLGEEQEEKKDGMPEGLQEGDTGKLLETRAENCETWADELERIANELPEEPDEINEDEIEGDTDEEKEEAREVARSEKREEWFHALRDALDEAQSADPGEE